MCICSATNITNKQRKNLVSIHLRSLYCISSNEFILYINTLIYNDALKYIHVHFNSYTSKKKFNEKKNT